MSFSLKCKFFLNNCKKNVIPLPEEFDEGESAEFGNDCTSQAESGVSDLVLVPVEADLLPLAAAAADADALDSNVGEELLGDARRKKLFLGKSFKFIGKMHFLPWLFVCSCVEMMADAAMPPTPVRS